MAKGHENLIPASQRSKEEARELGRKGGLASVKSRRRKRQLRDSLELLLTLPPDKTTDKSKLAKMGIPDGLVDNETMMNLALLRKALAGDTKAYEVIRSVIGEDSFTPMQSDTREQIVQAIRGSVSATFEGVIVQNDNEQNNENE